MKKLIKYPSTPQFREFVGNIKAIYEYVRTYAYMGENDEVVKTNVYDDTLPKPTLSFRGTVKLHGTNSSVSYNDTNMWSQSKDNILSIQEDNAGFCSFVEYRKEQFLKLFKQISTKFNIDTSKNSIVIYGEYAGKGIQKNVGVCNLPKSFFIFGVKIAPFDEEQDNYWLQDYSDLRDNDYNIYNILDFKTYTIEIDFNHPEKAMELLDQYTLEVESECPVAKQFGYDNTVGEGLCWTSFKDGNRLIFKTKGSKHSVKKERISNPIDDERIANLTRIADIVTPSWRLDQMLNETFNTLNGGVLDIKRMGDYIKNVINDIIKEELYTLRDENVEIKEVSKYVSNISRNYFLDALDRQAGLK